MTSTTPARPGQFGRYGGSYIPETLAPAATVAPAPPPTTTSWDGSPLIQSIVSPSLPATPKKTKAERR